MILSLDSEPFREGVTGEMEALERPGPELLVRRRLPVGGLASRKLSVCLCFRPQRWEQEAQASEP